MAYSTLSVRIANPSLSPRSFVSHSPLEQARDRAQSYTVDCPHLAQILSTTNAKTTVSAAEI